VSAETILIVDDVPGNIDVLAEILGKNYDIRFALSGREALELIANNPPDLVLLDVMMPEMNGFETLMALKLNPATHDVPVIFVTAKTDADSESGALLAGAVDFIHKPINGMVVQARVSMHLRLLAQERALHDKSRRLQTYHDAQEAENRFAVEVLNRQMRLPSAEDARIRYWLNPATTFSGDVLSVASAPDGRIFILLADATGHGLAAAITTQPLLTVYHAMVDQGADMQQILFAANQTLLANLPRGRFVALAMLCLDLPRQMAQFWNGGMPDILVLGATGEVVHQVASHCFPLGVTAMPEAQFEIENMSLPPDCQLVMYSDGLPEAHNHAGEEFGTTRLFQALSTVPAEARLSRVQDALLQHLGMPVGHDDITLLMVNCGS
jgi:serine phosphatase RsbU (regulator of sigma subunit)